MSHEVIFCCLRSNYMGGARLVRPRVLSCLKQSYCVQLQTDLMPSLLALFLLGGLLLSQAPLHVSAQSSCSVITREELPRLLEVYVILEGEENFKILCLSHGRERGGFSYATVVVNANETGDGGAVIRSNVTILLPVRCDTSNQWGSNGPFTVLPNASVFEMPLRENCSQCGTSPICIG